MSVRVKNYIIVGVKLPYKWNCIETGDDTDEDVWYDKYEKYLHPEAKQIGIVRDSMSGRYTVVGKVLAVSDYEDDLGFHSFNSSEIDTLISETRIELFNLFEINEQPSLLIFTHYS